MTEREAKNEAEAREMLRETMRESGRPEWEIHVYECIGEASVLMVDGCEFDADKAATIAQDIIATVWQAALASRQGAEGVAIQLDPRWKWCAVHRSGAVLLHRADDRPERFHMGCGDFGWTSAKGEPIPIIFANLKPSTLYEILDGRFVERESHA